MTTRPLLEQLHRLRDRAVGGDEKRGIRGRAGNRLVIGLPEARQTRQTT